MSKKLFWSVLIVAIILSLTIEMVGISNPITDEHGFRQAQTAISTYYLIQDGFSIFYQTPVFGYPWIIPFEFPVYQYIVAAFKILSHLPLDISGRCVSLFFYYGLLIYFYSILKVLNLELRIRLIALMAVIFSPIYLFWSRTFMIESTALFFSLGFVFYSLKYLKTNNCKYLIFAPVFVMLASLSKITSVFPSLVFLAIICLHECSGKILNKKLILLAISLLLAVIPVLIYTHYADAYKMQNVFSQFITSKSLKTWNFGSISQRMELSCYQQILNFTKHNITILIIPTFFSYLFCIRSRCIIQFAAVMAYLSNCLVLFNLYYIHLYYYYSNAIFGLLFIAIEIGYWTKMKSHFNVILPLAIIILVGLFTYKKYYFEVQSVKNEFPVKIGGIIEKTTHNDQFSIICGADWDSQIPYYSNRRAIMLRSDDQTADLLEIINKSGGLGKVGAVVELNNHDCKKLDEMFFSLGFSNQKQIDGNKYLLR